MVVNQEMAEIYPPTPEDLSEFLPETDCGKCGYEGCLAFAEAGTCSPRPKQVFRPPWELLDLFSETPAHNRPALPPLNRPWAT